VCWTLRGNESWQRRQEKCGQHACHRFGSYSTGEADVAPDPGLLRDLAH
jgi:hypothetical protein